MTTTKTARQKGKDLEDYCADQIESKGLGKASRSTGSGSGTREKADINTDMTILGRNVGIECKNQARASVKDWWLQAQKLGVLGREPIVAYKLKGEGYPETKVIIYLETFLDLCVRSKAPKQTASTESREERYKIERLIQAAKEILKLYK